MLKCEENKKAGLICVISAEVINGLEGEEVSHHTGIQTQSAEGKIQLTCLNGFVLINNPNATELIP